MADQIPVVEHGSNANFPRPSVVTAPVIYWKGTVQPLQALPQDLWYDSDEGA